ncbi:MAG: hypothetical protein QNK34_05525 [Woeseiaceae bacterium]|nr:hypothetical protein [Woeseiaceae bacterium]
MNPTKSSTHPTDLVAERRLRYGVKGSDERIDIVVRVGVPFIVEEGTVDFPVDGEISGCCVEIVGLPREVRETYYGADQLQALQLAANIDPLIRRFERQYDFFFCTGEPYFEG